MDHTPDIPETPPRQDAMARLKELLFDRETRELDALHRRLMEMHARAGSDEQFQKTLAKVLDRAIREAEATRHRELSEAMSPMVLRTLRIEMRSPAMQDQIAGVMYPRMGEMVKRYVSSAVRDMMQEINRRLESGLAQNRFSLWVRSLTSGRSMAELALAATQKLEVQEVYLIQRGSGALVHHWRRPGKATDLDGNNRDTLVSGFLTAISALAEEAFEADKESLRTLDLDNHRIYLRGSPDYLLAAKCIGSAPAGIERNLDEALIRVLGQNRTIEQEESGGEQLEPRRDALLTDFSEQVERATRERAAEVSRAHGMRTLKFIAWFIGLPLAAMAGWYFYVTFVTQSLQGKADRIIAAVPKLKGYPVKAHVEWGGHRIWVTGLAPDETTRRVVLAEIKALAPNAEMSEAVSVLPKADVHASLTAEGFRRAAERAELKLTTLITDLAAARGRLKDETTRNALEAAESAAQAAITELARPRGDDATGRIDQGLKTAFDKLAHVADRLARLAGSETAPAQPSPQDPTQAADAITLLSDRIAALATTIEQRLAVAPIAKRIDAVGETAAARSAEIDRLAEERITALDERYRARLDELERQLAAQGQARVPVQETPRQKLEAFTRSHAVFFSNDSEYRDPRATSEMLDRLAELMRETNVVLRVVGYTDEVGTSIRNSPLSQARADRVVADLAARGVPRSRMTALGRLNALVIAQGGGVDNPNRRAEFELAFVGERGGQR